MFTVQTERSSACSSPAYIGSAEDAAQQITVRGEATLPNVYQCILLQAFSTELGGLARPALGAAADPGLEVVTACLLQVKLLSGYAVKKYFAGTLSARVSAPKAMLARFT